MCRLWVIKTIRGSIPMIAITDDWLWDFDFDPDPGGDGDAAWLNCGSA